MNDMEAQRVSEPDNEEKTRRIMRPGGVWLGRHVKQLRLWLSLSQMQMAEELSLQSNSAISFYEKARPDVAIKGLMAHRLKELADRAGAEIIDVPPENTDKVVSLPKRATTDSGGVEKKDMNKPTGTGTRSTREDSDPLHRKVESILSQHADDPHSEIQHLSVVNLADGGIEFRSTSIGHNAELADAFAEDTNFLTFMQEPRNRFNLTCTIDSYMFAIKFDENRDQLLIGAVPVRGETFHFMAVKKKMERIVADLAAILSE